MQTRADAPGVRAAARRVSTVWSSEESDFRGPDLEREIEILLRLLEQDAEQHDPELSGPPLGFMRRRLLEQLRAEVMRVWRADPEGISPSDMLEVVLAFERVRTVLHPQVERIARVRGAPNGLELLVEVAHDFRAALTSIIHLSEALRRGHGGALSEVQRHQLSIIYRAALTLMTTANDVIEITGPGEHLIESEPAAFSLAHTLESVMNVVRPIAEEKGLELTVSVPAVHIRIGNPAALNRVLLNLATNALKFTEQGGVHINLTEYDGSRVEFAVKDTGSGISEHVLASLYQPFRRTATRDSGYYFSGSGLGLATCRKLVKAMGSELHVETSPGRGTRFFFVLELPPVPR